MLKIWLLLVVVLSLVHLNQGTTFVIDVDNYKLIDLDAPDIVGKSIDEKDEDPLLGFWPTLDDGRLLCSPSIDAEFFHHENSYQVNHWFFEEVITSANSAYAVVMHIYDIDLFVNYGLSIGVWTTPQDCKEIWHNIMMDIAEPLLSNADPLQNKAMIYKDHGIVYAFECVKWTADQEEYRHELYHVCSTNELYDITQLVPGSIVKMRKQNE